MDNEKRIIKRVNVKKKVPKIIPETVEYEEIEVDTLQEFLEEFDISEDDLRIAVKSYQDDKVSQPSYDDSYIFVAEKEGRRIAREYIDKNLRKGDEIVVKDIHVADALVEYFKEFTCTGKAKNPDQYILIKV